MTAQALISILLEEYEPSVSFENAITMTTVELLDKMTAMSPDISAVELEDALLSAGFSVGLIKGISDFNLYWKLKPRNLALV